MCHFFNAGPASVGPHLSALLTPNPNSHPRTHSPNSPLNPLKVISPLPATRCVDIISVIIAEKIEEDAKTKAGGKNKSVADYTIAHFSNKHGSGKGV